MPENFLRDRSHDHVTDSIIVWLEITVTSRCELEPPSEKKKKNCHMGNYNDNTPRSLMSLLQKLFVEQSGCGEDLMSSINYNVGFSSSLQYIIPV